MIRVIIGFPVLSTSNGVARAKNWKSYGCLPFRFSFNVQTSTGGVAKLGGVNSSTSGARSGSRLCTWCNPNVIPTPPLSWGAMDRTGQNRERRPREQQHASKEAHEDADYMMLSCMWRRLVLGLRSPD